MHPLHWNSRILLLRKNGDFNKMTILVGIVLLYSFEGYCNSDSGNTLENSYDWAPPDAEYITSAVGENIIFNCDIDFSGNNTGYFIVQWEKKGVDVPIHIWYENYPTHVGEGYEGRVSRVNSSTSYGLASLNLTNIRESDGGWYNCKVFFLNKPAPKNYTGSWYHLDVRVFPRFVHHSEDIVYTQMGENISLYCQAEGTPRPEIVWFKGSDLVQRSDRVLLLNGGIELQISQIKDTDVSDYLCLARNAEGAINHTIRVIISEPSTTPSDPADPAQVTHTQTLIYLPHRGSGVVRCNIQSNPPIQFVMWTKDRRLLEPYETNGYTVLSNGSLLIDWVHKSHEGMYTCTPYNSHGTKGSSLPMQVIVMEPPEFDITPDPLYLRKVGSSLEIPCTANGTNTINWQRRDGQTLQIRDRIRIIGGSLIFTNLHESDYGEYECVASNEVGTVLARVTVAGPHPSTPQNLTIVQSPETLALTLMWAPPVDQRVSVAYYQIQYRRCGGAFEWESLNNKDKIIPPRASYTVKSGRLVDGETYAFRVVAFATNIPPSNSEEISVRIPPIDRRQEITGAGIAVILFFVVVITLVVLAVKICKRKKQSKQTKAYIPATYNLPSCGALNEGGAKSHTLLK